MGRHGVCSHHGHADALIPCCEIPETSVTTSEADAYRQFVTGYSQYWRTFFDPIAIKVQATPERYRLETIVLPLINNSMYQSMAMALGGEPKPLAGNITSDAVMSLSFAIAKQRLLEQSGWQPPEEIAADEPKAKSDTALMRASSHHLKQIGLAAHNYHDTYAQFPAFSKSEKGRPLLSWRVMVLPFLEQAALYNEFHLDEPWDSDPTFDVQLTSILPEMFAGRQGAANMLGSEAMWIGMAIASLTSPVYVDVAVEDAAVVDAFLTKLDEGAAIEARTHTDFGWFAFKKDFYSVQISDTKARSFVLSLGPIKWRFFYARIGSPELG